MVAPYVGFVVFGAFWGTWGASIPAVRDQASVSEGQLGTALLFVGLGALPAMPAAGRLVDRWGQRAAGMLLAALGTAGVLVAGTAADLVTLSLGLAALGAASGAADVAINAAAGSAQQNSGRPVIPRAHAAFSAAVVVASLGTGALRAAGAPLLVPFAVMAAAAGAAAVLLLRTAPPVASGRARAHHVPGLRARTRLKPLAPLLVLGGLGALAFAVENGHQSWSALYLRDVLDAGPATAAAGPAVFAAVVAITRLLSAGLSTRLPVTVLLAGSVLAAAGTAVLGMVATVAAGLLGLGLAAAGTAVLFPTLLSVLTTHVPNHVRGAATSVVTTVAYLGFLTGPVYVGLWAEAVGLPEAITALAALAAVMAVVAPLALRHRSMTRGTV